MPHLVNEQNIKVRTLRNESPIENVFGTRRVGLKA